MSGKHGIFGPEIFDKKMGFRTDEEDKNLHILEGEINSFIANYEKKRGRTFSGKIDIPLNQKLVAETGIDGKRKLVRFARGSGWVVAKVIQRKGVEYLHLEE